MNAPQVEYTYAELLSEHDFEEPLFGSEVRCHGGYINGEYVSPRAKIRSPAIDAWRRRLQHEGQPLIHIPAAYVPPHYPNYRQAKFLLQEGIVNPISRSLTLISIVEGFGARIREVRLPNFREEIKEPIDGTALAHLAKGLFEAHARDEAGHRNQGGHKQMWEAARDIGLNKPEIPGDVLLRMMSGGAGVKRQRVFPELSSTMEDMITFLANILVVETFAEDVFAWATQLLGDPEVSHDAEGAAHLVRCIRADEKPHVDYLTVALSELRARTLVSADGQKEYRGSEVVDRIFANQLRGAASNRPQTARLRLQQEIHESIVDKDRAASISGKFESLDSGWTFPKSDDESLDILLQAS